MAISELEDLIDRFSVKYGAQIGDGLTAAVFRTGDRVKKVYSNVIGKREVFMEAHVMACVEAEGISAPRVYGVYLEDGYWVLEMDYIPGVSLLCEIAQSLDNGDEEKAYSLVRQMAREQARINLTQNDGFPSSKAYAEKLIRHNESLSKNQRDKLIKHLMQLPDGNYICHGDLHPNNYLIDSSGKLVAIDWPEVGHGVPACDAARTYLNMCHPAMIRNGVMRLSDVFLEEYCAAAHITKSEVEEWLPIQAGMLIGYKKKDFSDVCATYLL